MEPIRSEPSARFDHLFRKLIAAVDQQRELRSDDALGTVLIDNTDQLHRLRSELATERRLLNDRVMART